MALAELVCRLGDRVRQKALLHVIGASIVDPPGTSSLNVGPVISYDPGPKLDPVVAYDPGPNLGPVIAHDPGPPAGQAPNNGLTGFEARDTFVFNFAGVGHATVIAPLFGFL